jgi:hypothetical protein
VLLMLDRGQPRAYGPKEEVLRQTTSNHAQLAGARQGRQAQQGGPRQAAGAQSGSVEITASLGAGSVGAGS